MGKEMGIDMEGMGDMVNALRLEGMMLNWVLLMWRV